MIISSEIPRVTVSSDQLTRPLSSFPSLFPSGGTILILERDRATAELRAAPGQEFYFRVRQEQAAQRRRHAAQRPAQHRVRHRNRTNRNGRGMPGLEDEDDWDHDDDDLMDDEDSDDEYWANEEYGPPGHGRGGGHDGEDSDDDMMGRGGDLLDPFSPGEVASAYPPPMSRQNARYQERLNQLGIETYTKKKKRKAAESGVSAVIDLEADDNSFAAASPSPAATTTTAARHPKSDAVAPPEDAVMGSAGTPDASGEDEEGEELCVICQCPFQEGDDLRRLPCLHRFHAECIARGLQYSSCCPVCKYDLTAGFTVQT